uniref:Uncharacterized protein n=1 Tax=Arundo donax TaxID=35708 RepID=A0A0A9BU73_ARUDO
MKLLAFREEKLTVAR